MNNNKFASLSIILGIVSLFTIASVILPIILGSIAIIFAVLSKGSETRMNSRAKGGLFTGLAAILCVFTIVGSNVYMYLYDDAYRARFNELYKETYGVTFDEYINELMEMYENDTMGTGANVNVNTDINNGAQKGY